MPGDIEMLSVDGGTVPITRMDRKVTEVASFTENRSSQAIYELQ